MPLGAPPDAPSRALPSRGPGGDGLGGAVGPAFFGAADPRRAAPSHEHGVPSMAKRTKSKPQERGFVLFDVVYEDGSQASNRRVPQEILGGLDGDEPARLLIEEQDEAIAQKSGRPRRAIESLTRSPPREIKLPA